nr:PREDICTED: uncharacterized protein LOC108951943 isoform X2 [Musa acuminata subsp. malaccensis]
MWNDAVLPSLSSPFSSSLGNTGPPWLQSSDDSTELQRVNCGGLLGALQEKSDGGSLTGSLRRFLGMSNVTGKGDPMMTTGCSAAGVLPKVVAERRKRKISRDPANKNQTPSSPSSKNPKTMCSKTMARMPLIKVGTCEEKPEARGQNNSSSAARFSLREGRYRIGSSRGCSFDQVPPRTNRDADCSLLRYEIPGRR